MLTLFKMSLFGAAQGWGGGGGGPKKIGKLYEPRDTPLDTPHLVTHL